MDLSIKKIVFLIYAVALACCSRDDEYIYETHKLISHTIHEFDWGHYPPIIPEYLYTTSLDSLLVIKDSIIYKHYESVDSTPVCIKLVDTLHSLYPASIDKSKFSDYFLQIHKEPFSPSKVKLDLNRINNKHVIIKNKINKNESSCELTGSVVFSRIAYDPKFSKAEFVVWFDCGALCGSGWLITAIKKDDKWVVDKKELLFVS